MTKKRTISSGFLAIENDKGLRAVFSTVGAGVYSLSLHGKKLILQPTDKKVFLTSPQYFGKTVGRVIGRLPSHIFILHKEYDLLSSGDGICLHGGGDKDFAFKDFHGIVISEGNTVGVEFVYVSPDGECGFPGALTTKVTYLIPKDSNEIIIRYEATTTKETIVSISNHIYWNIFSDENVNGYRLTVHASRVGVFKEGTELIVDSKPVPKYLDYREGLLLKDSLDEIQKQEGEIKTLDHAFLFDRVDPSTSQVIVESPKARIECYTDYDGVNLYVDNTNSPVAFDNGELHDRRAIAIEPQCFPLDDRILVPGKTYRHEIRYRIIEKQ